MRDLQLDLFHSFHSYNINFIDVTWNFVKSGFNKILFKKEIFFNFLKNKNLITAEEESKK